MALLTFPPAPFNGQYYPVSPLPGQYQYRWSSTDATWRLEGVATGVVPGVYGSASQIPILTIDYQGRTTAAGFADISTVYVKTNNPIAFNSYIWPNADGSAATTLRTDGAGNLYWGSGGVTSVDVSGGTTGLTFTGGPITSSGTVTMGGVLGTANGGTGVTTGVVTSILAGTAISVSAATGVVTINNTGVTSNVAGSGISVSSSTGAVTISNSGVLSVDGGTTGLTPVLATTGAVSLGGVLSISSGGTGQVTASAALTALLPSQAGNANKVLTTDGANASWGSAPVKFVQYDDISSSFDGVATNGSLTVGGVPTPPSPASNIMVFLGGVAQTPGAANSYTVAGSTITFSTPPAPGTFFYAVTVSA